MSRRARAKPPTGIQAFPFLAVLLCTTGALVVLLFVFARHGQCLAAQAKANAAQPSVDGQELEWRIRQLQQARDKTEAQLTDGRMQLSHIEDHERRLREEFDRLKTSILEMQRTTVAGVNQRRQTTAELDQLKLRIAQAEAELQEARHDSKNKGVCYSVVPYQGPNQTRRRPIYIECGANEVILQPEGIVFKESDFEGPLGPGNPLAAALRAVREQMAAKNDASSKDEPYPLLLVRPDGVGAYYAARAALSSWGSEYGYELVGGDWQIQFPESDPQLRQTVRAVVTEARLRQEEQILAAPRQYARGDRPVYRASRHGGFEREGGSSHDDQSTGAFSAGKRGDGALAEDEGSTGSGGGGSGSGGNSKTPAVNPYQSLFAKNGAAGAGTSRGAGGAGLGGTALAQNGGGFPAGGAGSPGGTGSPGGGGYPAGTGGSLAGNAGLGMSGAGSGGGTSGGTQGSGNSPQSGNSSQSGSLAQSGGYAQPGTGPGQSTGTPRGTASGGPNGTMLAQNGAGLGDSGAGSPAGAGGSGSADSTLAAAGGGFPQGGAGSAPPGGTAAKGGPPPGGNSSTPAATGPQAGPYSAADAGATSGSAGAGSSQASSGSSAGGVGGSTPPDPNAEPGGMPSPSITINANKPKPDSLAKKRGRDWGVPDASNRRVGVTRPVFVVCAPDRLIILPEQGSGGGKEVPVGAHMQDSIDELVAGVSQHVKTWGIAGKGLYWRPTLIVEIRPGAAPQYAELKALMADSGLEIKERQHPGPLANAPTNTKTR